MTEETTQPTTTSDADDARVQVLQAVVDRVTSWQEGSDEATVRKELDDAIAASDVDVAEDVRQRIVTHITAEGAHVDVREFLA